SWRALLSPVAAGDRRVEQEVVDLGVSLGLPDVVAPDVGTMVGDEDGERLLEPWIGEDAAQLLDELAFSRRVPDHRDEVRVAVGDAADGLQHLQAADPDVAAVAAPVAGTNGWH